jgi:transposase
MWTDCTRRQYERLGGRYATDLTDTEFALIEPFLPPPKAGGRLRRTSLREVLSAILYVLRTGCQWRLLPTMLAITIWSLLRQAPNGAAPATKRKLAVSIAVKTTIDRVYRREDRRSARKNVCNCYGSISRCALLL